MGIEYIMVVLAYAGLWVCGRYRISVDDGYKLGAVLVVHYEWNAALVVGDVRQDRLGNDADINVNRLVPVRRIS